MRNFVSEHITGLRSCRPDGTEAPGKRQTMDQVTGMWAAIAGSAGMVWKATLIASVVLVGLGATRPAHALDAYDRSQFVAMPGGNCAARVDQASTGASVMFRDSSHFSAAGGSLFSYIDGAVISRTPISVSWLETYCGYENITGLVQDGADGTVASDDAMFVRFTADVPGIGRYDFDLGLYGVSGTVAKRDVVLVDPAPTVAEKTQKLIAGFMQTRANLLLRHQPGLTRFLSGKGGGTFGAHVTRNQGNFDFASNAEYPFWAELTGAWSKDDTSQSEYFFGAVGAHHQITPNLIVGAMAEVDRAMQGDGQAEIEGTGWMIGPYFVAKSAEHPLYFEGRLLYGESRNRIAPFGTYKDEFDTQRLLAQFKIVGEVVQGSTTWSPFLDASYATDDQDAYTDSLGNTIPSQGIELGQVELGLDFSKMMQARLGEFELWGGISGIWSSTSGSGFARSVTPAYEGGRARIKLGANLALPDNQRLSISGFYDGIGATEHESYGLSFGYEKTF